jgi:RNA polymerase sigma factor (sigma-70 family)
MEEFVLSHELRGRLLSQISKRARNRNDAEDLLHSAYLRLVRYQEDHTVDNVEAFLVRAALNIDIDNYRRDRFLTNLAYQEVFSSKESPLQDEALAAQIRLRRVKLGLSRLSARSRDILLMHRLENLTYQQIAERQGISRSAVEKHVMKAVRYLTIWSEGW